MQQLSGVVTIYSMPEDGAQAEAAFLAVLGDEHETYIQMYGDTLPDLYNAIAAADAAGIVTHSYLDHVQASSPTEHPMVVALAAKLQHGDITIGPAGPDAQVSGQIAHRKQIIDVAGNCCLGSVNASRQAFYSQTNDMVSFTDVAYAAYAIRKFWQRVAWARGHMPQFQVMELHPDTPVVIGGTVKTVTTTTVTVKVADKDGSTLGSGTAISPDP